jgi:diguanylate cyclase (GGDEF)-like protein/PAS domain S-box-containing protein
VNICPNQCLLQEFADPVLLTDTSGIIRFANAAVESTSGYSPEELVGKTASLLKSDEHDGEFFRHFWKTILSGDSYRGVFANRNKDGSIYHEDKTVTPILDDTGAITHFLSVGKDITERVEEQRRLEKLAYFDELTGLPNRTVLQDRLSHALSKARRNGTAIAVLFVDLDQFKSVNDTLGHAAGDELLRVTADRIRSCLRECDTVVRLAGDEFIVVLEELHEGLMAHVAADKLMAAIVRPLLLNQHRINITCSIGVSIGPDVGDNVDSVLKKADVAMYAAKQKGRNNYQSFSGELLRIYNRFNQTKH